MANTFTCDEKLGEAMEGLSTDDRRLLEIAICEYGFYGIDIETNLPRKLKAIFSLMKYEIEDSSWR